MLVPARNSFGQVFPFHIAVDRELRIVQAGPALLKLSGGRVLGMPLAEAFAIERPGAYVLTAEALWHDQASLFVLRGRVWNIGLKGQWLAADGDGSKLVFVAAARISDLGELTALGLTPDDMALHSSTVELTTALSDARRHAERLAEQSRRLEERRAEAVAANSAKSEFIATISHEIRTPLNGILGLADLLLDAELETQDLGMVKAIRMSGEVLRDLLNDILDLSRLESGKLSVECRDFSVQQMLDAVLVVWETRIHAQGLRFDLELPDDLPLALKGDPARIRQILVNFLSNAAKFTEQGGIALRVRCEPAPGPSAGNDGWVELVFEVEDSGIGIDDAFMAQLFERFTQADPSITRKYGGSGLGLSICRELAELMGGRIEAESASGRGSTFRLRLTCAPGEPAAVESEAWTDRGAGRRIERPERPLTILVAEDNVLNQTVIRGMLTRAGHEVDAVSNGYDAVAAAGRRAYDLVLMDVQMPELDGIKATCRIRAIEGPAGRVPIIAVTANSDFADRDDLRVLGLSEHVAKPIEPTLLFAAIERQLARPPTAVPPGPHVPVRPAPTVPVAPSPAAEAALKELLAGLEAFD